MNREQRAALLAEEMKAFQALFEPYLEGLLPGEGLEQQTVARRHALQPAGRRKAPPALFCLSPAISCAAGSQGRCCRLPRPLR